MVCRMLFAAALAVVLVGPAAAQDEKPAIQDNLRAGTAKTAFEDIPFRGEVTADNLYVRRSPSTDPATSLIAAVLKGGEKVVVVGMEGDFFQIAPPRGTSVWIFARNVKREEGDAGVVIGNDVPVRFDSRSNADKLGTLNEGAQVKILKEHLGWYQIAAPDCVKYYVAKRYVRYVDKSDLNVPVAPSADAEALAKMREADELAAEQRALLTPEHVMEVDFGKVAAAYETAAELAKSSEVRKEALSEAKTYRQLEASWAAAKAQILSAEEQVRQLKEKIDEQHRVEPPKWEFSGYVDTVGRLASRPGTHKLVMAGKVVCFLRPKEGNDDMERRLNSLYEKYVGVKGTVIENPPGWEGYSVVIVESVEEIGQ